MNTWVRAGFVLINNGHGSALLVCRPAMETRVCDGMVADQQWKHGCVLRGRWSAMDT